MRRDRRYPAPVAFRLPRSDKVILDAFARRNGLRPGTDARDLLTKGLRQAEAAAVDDGAGAVLAPREALVVVRSFVAAVAARPGAPTPEERRILLAIRQFIDHVFVQRGIEELTAPAPPVAGEDAPR